jgi:hypothetical protein
MIGDKLLTAAEYREALTLLLGELRNLPHDPLDKAEQLGRLQGHLQTLIGDSPYSTPPISALRVMRGQRKGAPRRVSPEASDRALRLRQETG